jgi:colicin import membrane protein
VPRTNLLKLGAASGAALAGVILAITSVAAHSTQASTLHQSGKSVVGTVIQAARAASFPLFQPEAPLSASSNSIELETEADAAELLEAQQKAAAEAAAEAAAAAAKAAEEVAEDTPPACAAVDNPEDVTEKAEAAEAAEPTTEAADQTEDATEKANDQTEDKGEAPCNNGDDHDKVKADHESDQGGDHEHSSDGSKKD